MSTEATYASVSSRMASNSLKQQSVKFACEDKGIKDEDIARAFMVQCDLEEVERIHPMPGNIWIVVFSTPEYAEEATNGFILKEKNLPDADGE